MEDAQRPASSQRKGTQDGTGELPGTHRSREELAAAEHEDAGYGSDDSHTTTESAEMHKYKHPHMHKLKDKIEHPFPRLRQKLKQTHLYDAKVQAYHFKAKIGKLGNIVNPNHRHDEEHEKETDRKRSAISESHRFDSFAPVREGHLAKWYIDGRNYFWAVSEALENAKESIYLHDWWISPELFLRRPPYFNQKWRLDKIIKRKAEQGVKIYIIIYKEVAQAISCNSAHTKNVFRNLCPKGSPGEGNIKVMRHPDHNFFENASDMVFYWAHHEKFVVIDYELAFVGGLDLCFGRWDNIEHPLADIHPAGVQHEIFPGQDFNNNRIMDFQNVDDWKSNELSKAEYGRMPWHDVAVGFRGPSVYDVAEHFVLRWNFCKRDKYRRDTRYPHITLEGREGDDEDLVAVQRPKFPVGGYTHHPKTPLSSKALTNMGPTAMQVVRSSADWSSGILTEHSIQNAYCELIRKAEHFVYIENQFFITATGDEQAPIHNKIGQSMVEACVRAGKEGRTFRIIIVIPAIPGFAGDLREDAAAGTRAIMDYQFKSISRGEHSIKEQIRAQGVDPDNHIFVFNLRSYDRLNTTLAVRKQEEKSGVTYQEMQRAEAEEIMAEGVHGTHGDSSSSDGGYDSDDRPKSKGTVQERAKRRKEKFEAERGAVGLQKNQVSVDSIAKDAMMGTCKVTDEKWENPDDPEDEREFFVQEELYIHAKVCIIDDKTVICGSSNINDRSQLGNHDSELTVVVQDPTPFQSTMDGKPYEASQFAATLRRTLWREHLGLLPPQGLGAEGDNNARPPGAAPNDYLNGEDNSGTSGEGEQPRADAQGQGTTDNDTNAEGTIPLDSSQNSTSQVSAKDHQKAWEFVADPLGKKVWKTWCDQATVNTNVFRELFHADPDDTVKTFAEYDEFLPRTQSGGSWRVGWRERSEEGGGKLDKIKSRGSPNKEEQSQERKVDGETGSAKEEKKPYKQGHLYTDLSVADVKKRLSEIKGHLVWMQLDFLKDEDTMAEMGLQVNSYTESIFT